MDAARAEIWLDVPEQRQLNWLRRSGVEPMALLKPTITMMTTGIRAHDGRFDFVADGMKWLVFEEDEDAVFWSPKTGQLATYAGRVFALGEALTKAAGEVSNRKLAGMLGVSHTTIQRDLSTGTSVPHASEEGAEIEGEIVGGGTLVPPSKPHIEDARPGAA